MVSTGRSTISADAPKSTASGSKAPRACLKRLAVAAAFAASFAALPAAAQITLDASFDHGALESWSRTGRSPINLVGRDNFYGGGQWRWLYFRADNVQNTTLTFSISNNFAGGASRLDNHTMVYSYDNENWQVFDNNDNLSTTYQFSNNTPFAEDQVYIAYSIPYSYGRSEALINQIKTSPWVQPTASADANLVIGQSPGGTDDLGRVQTPKDTWGFKITDPNSTGPKTKIAILSGVHAGETLGRLQTEGMIEWLVSGDPRAVSLRRSAEFFIYPLMNPDGVFSGSNRATLTNPNSDPNGDWNPAQFNVHPDNKLIGEAMIADTGADVDYFIDFHSTIPTSLQTDFAFLEFGKNNQLDPVWLAYTAIEPQVEQIDSTSTGWISANFADWELDAEFDATFETMFLPNPQEQYYLDLGASMGIAFFDGLGLTPPLTGDYEGDGQVDGADFALWQSTFGDTGVGLPADGNGNGVIDAADYTVWRDNATATFFTIPEPGGFAFVALAAIGWSTTRTRRSRHSD